jgi:hypothetical protein
MPTTSNIWTETFAPGGDNTYNQQNHPSPMTTPPQLQNNPLLLPGGEQFIPNEELMGQPRQNVGTYKDGPAKNCRLPIDGKSYKLTYNSTYSLMQFILFQPFQIEQIALLITTLNSKSSNNT